MRYVDLPVPAKGAASQVSALGFGCAALMGRVGRKDSHAALAAAYEGGITFFDTARSYGYGESEALLGEFLQDRRQSSVICTKFGILPSPKGGWKQKIKPLAQAAIRVFPALRERARRAASSQIQHGQFSVEVLQSSFETSLRALRTDYVDLLLLHAATLEVLDQDDLLEALGRLVEQGKVRMAGISGEHPVIAETFRRRPHPLSTAQFALNTASLDFVQATVEHTAAAAPPRSLFLVANHPFGGPSGVASVLAAVQSMRHAESLPPTLRAKLAEDDPHLMPEIVLNAILQNTGVSAVVPAMMRLPNLRSNLRALEHCRFTREELALLRRALVQQSRPALQPAH